MASERVTNSYQRLFEVQVLHHYWLDDGAMMFDSLSSADRTERLLRYDVRRLLTIEPTPATAQLLAGLRCVSRSTALGIVVGAPSGEAIPDDVELEYTMSVVDPAFASYTALTLRPQTLHTLQHTPTLMAIRFKENVAVYSNLTGAARGAGPSKALYLSREIAAATGSEMAESLVAAGGALVQLDGDEPGASTHQVHPTVSSAPVFANQLDIPAIVPPAGLVGTAPARGIQLDDDMDASVYAVIRLAATGAADADFNVTALGLPKTPAPVFQIRLKNRSTLWRYFDRASPGAPTSESGPFPLTYFGNATTTHKPSAGIVIPETSGTAVTRIVSEIYV
jgi:hypothetical protein